eukprot:4475069-Pyramimonas_sp.AAC.1
MLVSVIEAEQLLLCKHLKDRYTSSIVFTDFEAAFPSISIPWTRFVLREMGFLEALIGFFEKLYDRNTAVVTLGGAKFGTFPVGRGVRQGDPSSMLLFVMAIEPILRWIPDKLPDHVEMSFGYADDLCFGFR